MKKHFKFLVAIFALIFTVGLVACGGNNDQKEVDKAHESLTVGYTDPDTKDSVTKDLTLRTTVGNVKVTWTSDKPTVVAIDGKVNRPSEDTTVKLTAELSLGKASKTKIFDVKVIKGVDYLGLLGRVELDLEKEAGIYITDKDITLPSTFEGVALTWVSADPATISNTGKVERPVFGQDDKNVSLTVSAGGEEHVIIVKVLAVAEEPLEDILNQAKDALLLPGVGDGVTDDIVLPLTVGSKGVTVTWVSSNPAVVSNTGEVVRGTEQVSVTLTATLHLEGYTGEAFTKEFSVVVLEDVPTTSVENIKAAFQFTTDYAKGTYIRINGVTVLGIQAGDGFVVADSSGILYVYDRGANADKVEVGKVIDIIGITSVYNGSPQVQAGKPTEPVLVRRSQAEATVVVPETVVDNVTTYLTALPTEYNDSAPLWMKYLTFNAYVRSVGNGNYDLHVVDSLDSPFDASNSSATTYQYNGAAVYYKSNVQELSQVAGLKVKFNAFLFTLRSDRLVYTVAFFGSLDDIEVSGIDQDIVDAVGEGLHNRYSNVYVAPTTLEFPTEQVGTSIVWTSSHPELINVDTGALVMPAEGQQDVTLTAVITKGNSTKTVTIIIKVGEAPVITIAEAKLESSGSVKVEGVLLGYAQNNTYFLQDATGGISLNIYNAPAGIDTALTGALGKVVVVEGTRTIFNGLEQINPTKVVVKEVGTFPTAYSLDSGELDKGTLLPHQGTVASITNAVVSEYQTGSNYVQFTLNRTDGKTIVFRWDTRASLSDDLQGKLNALQDGDKVSIVNATISWYNNPQMTVLPNMEVTVHPLTDAEKIALAKAALVAEFDGKVYDMESDIALPATGARGTTITWAYDPADAIADGKWKVVTADTAVDLTATVKLGETQEDQVLNVTIKFVDPEGPAEHTATLSYTGDTTSNMADGNNATIVGLDANIFSVTSDKGSATNHIGLATGPELRIYSVRADGNGNTLMVSVDGTKYQIKSIEIVFTATTAASKLTLGETVHDLTAEETKSKTLTYSDLSIASFSLKNVHSGGSSNLQLRITSISITYVQLNP